MATNDLSDITGFVLREFAYKETSKIIEVFSKDLGRISIIAKGALGKKAKPWELPKDL
ncbi:DNA repair protein RecO [Anaerococcus cruorum]|uniref:DNA repair protein RecO n=1 Tax=Anaerococcus sp. WGS1596 TaxID=3366806 RepID=UPI00372D40DA